MGCDIKAFRNLVFEGGGVKGIAYGGALTELDEMGLLPCIERVAGTSAGAINATLLALGYSASESSQIISETKFSQFADDSWWIFKDIRRFFKHYGWHKGRAFFSWIGKLIARKTGKKDLTFAQLKDLGEQGNSSIRDLYVVATNLTDQIAEIYSHETTPDMPIQHAVRMSMSIPLYFQCVRRNDDVFVDGGVTWNYPVNIFDSKRYVNNPDNGQGVKYNTEGDYVFNHETLGFRLDSKDDIAYNAKGWANVPKEINSILDYSIAIITFLQESANKRHLHKNDWSRTVFIDTLGVKTTDFDLSDAQISDLIESGRRGVKEHFEWRLGEQGVTLPASR